MKAIFISLFLLCVVLCGCSTPTKTIGRDFDETRVSQIKKGVTTAEGVVALFGEPDSKQFVSTNQVMWHYTYRNEVRTYHHSLFSPAVEQTTGFKKNLDLLLQDDIVINFAYVKSPIQLETILSSALYGNKTID